MILVPLLALYPLWWVLGLGVLIFPIAAVPMALSLHRRHARSKVTGAEPVRLPPGFVLWLAFGAVLVAGLAALNAEPVGAVVGGFNDRIIGVGYRLIQYGSLTVLLIYAGNLPFRAMSQRLLVGLLGWMFVVTVLGGLLGTFAGGLELTSPVEMLLPKSITGKGFVRSLVHPYAAQIMDLVGDPKPRPAAPWGYTNTWGNNYCLLIGWFLVAIFGYTTRLWVKLLAVALIVLSLIPVVHSLNRGLWIGLGVAAVYLGVRQALAGKAKPLIIAAVAGVAIAVVTVTTPLGDVVQRRLDNGKSNGVRMFLTERAMDGMRESPVLGFGSTRNTMGGRQSITIGESEACERCGNFTIGGNGQLWQLLFAHGLAGTLAYFGFFGYGLWRFRRDRSPIGLAASTAIVGSFVASLWYNSLVTPLAFTFLAYVLLWRNNMPAAAVEPHVTWTTNER
ncbi:MAG TPA: hypothetical protein DGT23_33370 [Micromonosporaceae bacterium]|nr:hypothetical protein [Micromonosporaceae bacterium]